jgi:cullin 3
VISFNDEFTSKLKRIKVPLVSLKDLNPSNENNDTGAFEVPATVEEDRRHLVEAAVVRIMKVSLKRLTAIIFCTL